jgi:5-methylthioadenosine/S-adenosylhomocysteine deaminase
VQSLASRGRRKTGSSRDRPARPGLARPQRQSQAQENPAEPQVRAPGSPSQLLIQNAALLLTMDPTLGQGEVGLLTEADLLLVGDTIAAVGRRLRAHAAQTLDATGKIVLPGFVDTHNHLWQALIRGGGTDQELPGWLATWVFPLAGFPFTAADVYAGVRLSTLDLITTGVTTTVNWSHAFTPPFVQGNLQALGESGLRFVFAYRGSAASAVLTDMRQVYRTLIAPIPARRSRWRRTPAPQRACGPTS